MDVIPLLLLTTLLASTASAQNRVWSTFAYIHTGEHHTLHSTNGALSAALTPQGASDLYFQGDHFRNRFLDNSSLHYIQGLESFALDNSQLSILSAAALYATGSATAFLQGLYPAARDSFAFNNGGIEAATNASTGNVTAFPLNGYQYPSISTAGFGDEDSMWVMGSQQCDASVLAQSRMGWEPLNGVTKLIFDQYLPGHGFQSNKFVGRYAWELWEYASYKFNHDETVRENGLTQAWIDMLEAQAAAFERQMHGTAILKNPDGTNAAVGAIAGRTLAGRVVQAFGNSMGSGGYSDKLTLLFGDHLPIVSFLELAEIPESDATEIEREPFEMLPAWGSALVWEMYTNGYDVNNGYPPKDKLRVRFYYVAEPGGVFDKQMPFSLNLESVPWDRFEQNMSYVGFNGTQQYCTACLKEDGICADNTLALLADEMGGSGSAITAPIAGAIGAVGTFVLCLVALALAAWLGGLRVHRVSNDAAAAGGGFKGDERGTDDKDIKYGRNGERAAKTGSWELRADAAGGDSKILGDIKVTTSSFKAREREEDEISILGPQVHPREDV